MATATATISATPASSTAPPAGPPLAVTLVAEGRQAHIPAAVVNLDSFCRWAVSQRSPRRGRFSFFRGTLWVDLSMEKMYSHNQVKTEFANVLGSLVKETGSGRYLGDGMLLRNDTAELSTEPDGMFVSYDALRTGRVRREEGDGSDCLILSGTPEMVLEVVSDSSVEKDTVTLLELYARAGIPEYWLVDVRGPEPRFDLFKHGPKGYAGARRQAGGWLKSNVFGRSFRLTRQADPLGDPQFVLAIRA